MYVGMIRLLDYCFFRGFIVLVLKRVMLTCCTPSLCSWHFAISCVVVTLLSIWSHAELTPIMRQAAAVVWCCCIPVRTNILYPEILRRLWICMCVSSTAVSTAYQVCIFLEKWIRERCRKHTYSMFFVQVSWSPISEFPNLPPREAGGKKDFLNRGPTRATTGERIYK